MACDFKKELRVLYRPSGKPDDGRDKGDFNFSSCIRLPDFVIP